MADEQKPAGAGHTAAGQAVAADLGSVATGSPVASQSTPSPVTMEGGDPRPCSKQSYVNNSEAFNQGKGKP
jgi:hypothetical protein